MYQVPYWTNNSQFVFGLLLLIIMDGVSEMTHHQSAKPNATDGYTV